ncbi:ABC transporter permease [Nocardioides litoris]|uniref:ABC transporter permease n=1 Tax=Nocardioides litoris TaxID=1926648 RepID=UPI00112424C4|nr:ABC transporter permease [Nocardioides litoris]
MLGFVVRRLLSSLIVLLLASFVVFAVFYLGPSNPARPVCEGAGGRCTPERLVAIEKQMGLDKPVLSAYGEFMGGIVKGREIDFGASAYDCTAPCLGVSYDTRNFVTDELKERIVPTILLAIGGSIVFLVVGVTTGILAASRRGSSTDRLLVSGSLLVSSIPYYLLCLIAWIFLTLQTNIFPATGYFPITENPLKTIGGLLLPSLVLGFATAPAYARYTRGQMVETLGDDFVRTASAKGLPRRRVLFRHALRAAIVPIVTIFGLDFGALLAGTIFTEAIFSIDGIGRWGLEALDSPLDLPVITATVLVGATFIVVSNLVVDIAYGFLDPRVRIG